MLKIITWVSLTCRNDIGPSPRWDWHPDSTVSVGSAHTKPQLHQNYKDQTTKQPSWPPPVHASNPTLVDTVPPNMGTRHQQLPPSCKIRLFDWSSVTSVMHVLIGCCCGRQRTVNARYFHIHTGFLNPPQVRLFYLIINFKKYIVINFRLSSTNSRSSGFLTPSVIGAADIRSQAHPSSSFWVSLSSSKYVYIIAAFCCGANWFRML